METRRPITLDALLTSEAAYWASQAGKDRQLGYDQKLANALRSVRRACEQNNIVFDETKARMILEVRLKQS
jgi:hypothetical protein